MYIQGINYDLRRMVAEKGLIYLTESIMGVLMEPDGDKPAILQPENFSLKELWEAVDVKDFPVVTGQLISKKIMDSYKNAARVGDLLTTNMPSDKLIDRIPGFERTGAVEVVKPGMPYPHTHQIKEKYVDIEGDKYGEILDVTEEAILFDQTNQILREAAQLGEDAAQDREYQIIQSILDLGAFKSYHPSGTQQDLYTNGGAAPHLYDNLITNVLADHTDIEAAQLLFYGMRNAKGFPIVMSPTTLLIPMALDMTAKTLMSSPVRLGDHNAVPNPVKNTYTIVPTPFLDMNSTTEWYIGDFKKQFMWKEVIPFQVQTRDRDSEAGWNRDIKASFKVRYYGRVGALDYVYVVKSLGTT
jgi:hypothetical protein